jgi:hypothetical protein
MLALFYQIEQQQIDQYDLKNFYELKNEEATVKKARRQYSRFVRKYVSTSLENEK